MWLQQPVIHVCQEEEMSELWGSISILTFRHTVKSGYSKSCSHVAIGYLWIVFQFKIWLLELYFESWSLELKKTYGCESWTVKKAEHWRIDAFELWCWRRLLRVPWTARRSNQSLLKEIRRVFFERTDAEAETPILWPPIVKSWLVGKDPDAGKDWGQEEKGMTEDEMAGWHHQLNGHEFEWTPGVSDGQGGLVCCDSWGRKELDATEQLNWTELDWTLYLVI